MCARAISGMFASAWASASMSAWRSFSLRLAFGRNKTRCAITDYSSSRRLRGPRGPFDRRGPPGLLPPNGFEPLGRE
jgi:hypothetical protein